MAFDLTTKGLTDRRYASYQPIQNGSQVAVSVNSNNLVKVYSFPTGSLHAANAGAISGGNFHCYTDYALNGQLQAIEWVAGNNTTGSLFITESGGAALQIWGTITRDLTNSFAIFPMGATVTTEDVAIGSVFRNIPLNTVLMVVGSDIGKGKGASGLNIAYI